MLAQTIPEVNLALPPGLFCLARLPEEGCCCCLRLSRLLSADGLCPFCAGEALEREQALRPDLFRALVAQVVEELEEDGAPCQT